MRFDIVVAPQAMEDYGGLQRAVQVTIKKAIAIHLKDNPEKVSKSKIKRLRGLRQPQFRLRIDASRVFYDVNKHDGRVEILRILPKDRVDAYLKQEGIPDEDTATDESQG